MRMGSGTFDAPSQQPVHNLSLARDQYRTSYAIKPSDVGYLRHAGYDLREPWNNMVPLDYDIPGATGISSGEGAPVYMDLNAVGLECTDNVAIPRFVPDTHL
jgi:hypothetical protein